MRKYLYLLYDVACVCMALVVALYLRHGVPLIQEGKPQDLYLLLLVTLVVSLVVFPLMRIHTNMWRHTSSPELADIMIAVALVVLICNSVLFSVSRLEMMPRSVPPMHWAVAVGLMGGSRVLVRKWFGSQHPALAAKQHVVVVGACHTAELYLQFIKRINGRPIVVEGFVDSDASLSRRTFQRHAILGTPEQLPEILEDFRVHGVQIKQIVLAKLIDELLPQQRKLLLQMKKDGVIDLVPFAKHIGTQLQSTTTQDTEDYYQQLGNRSVNDYAPPIGYYPYVKRGMDVLAAAVLVVMLSPLWAITAVLVGIDVGMPILFWQQRPGRYGKPFRLYKFRTMRPAGRKLGENRLAHKSNDAMRTSFIGKWLRRLRLDELPQLFHIIGGTMSFVGPRPLLPEDQPEGGAYRLSVRPGVTGFAQIHGGDALTPEEKLMLDVWYIRHMSLALDVQILLRTLIVVLKEDTPKRQVIARIKRSFKKGIPLHEQL